jgi:peptidoglycan/xylan/chitin deacetylase (PgdA/CDA1 family)
MPLREAYLDYPRRRQGSDQDRYPWALADGRTRREWPGGAAVAAMIVVPIEHHPLNPSGKPFKHPGAMQTPYPDLRHYTTRDYGSRVGAFRILDALAAAGLKAVFPINAVMLDRAPPLIDAIRESGHEVAAYGWSTDAIHWSGLEEEAERALVARTRARFSQAQLEPVTWMSPARQQSFRTLDLIAAEGFTVCLDWEPDEVPIAMQTASGSLTAVPLYNELDDRTLLVDRRQSEDEWADQVLEAARYLTEGADRYGGRVLSFTLTPYVAGLPFRMAALRRILGGLAADPAVWNAT